MYKFDYCCVSPKDMDELTYIVDNMKEISLSTFIKNVSLDEVNQSLMYGINYRTKEQFKNDWSITAYKLKRKNIDVFVLKNSAIEYVFKN